MKPQAPDLLPAQFSHPDIKAARTYPATDLDRPAFA
jgi:hypothetical protein